MNHDEPAIGFVFRPIWLLFCSFMVVLMSHEIWQVKTRPAEYAFLWGSEGPVAGLWWYASERAYLLLLVGEIILFLAGIWLCLSRMPFRTKLLSAHLGLSVLWIIYLNIS